MNDLVAKAFKIEKAIDQALTEAATQIAVKVAAHKEEKQGKIRASEDKADVALDLVGLSALVKQAKIEGKGSVIVYRGTDFEIDSLGNLLHGAKRVWDTLSATRYLPHIEWPKTYPDTKFFISISW